VTLAHLPEYPPMSKSKHRGRLRGRKRKSGPRHPSGRLKWSPPEPNARVMAERQARLGSGAARGLNADDPLDVAFARGWLTERMHRAGRAFANAHSRAGLGGPRLDAGGLSAPDESIGTEITTWAHMTDAEIAAIWDQVSRRTPSGAEEGRAAMAMELWARLCHALTPGELHAVELCAVHGRWPRWLTYRLDEPAGLGPLDWIGWAMRAGEHERERLLLRMGLERIAGALWAKAAPPQPDERSVGEILRQAPSRRLKRPAGRKVEEATVFVDGETGEAILEVVRKVRV